MKAWRGLAPEIARGLDLTLVDAVEGGEERKDQVRD